MAPFKLPHLIDRFLGSREIEEPGPEGAMVNPLTRLPSRMAVVRELKNTLSKAHKRPVALAIIDFSNIQGLMDDGSRIDPDLLLRLSRMLTSRVQGHLVGHLRDREFAVILRDMPISAVENLADEIINAVRTDESLEDDRRFIATIVGVGYSSKGDCRAPQLMGLADIAMHYALATGRGCHIIVDRIPSHRAA